MHIKFFQSLAVALVLLYAPFADAHFPVVTTDPIAPLAYTTFPQVYTVTGTVRHNPLNVVQDLTLLINGVSESLVPLPFASVSGTTTAAFSLPWNIAAPGVYTVQVKARHGIAGQTGSSTIQDVVVSEAVVVVRECEAAPAHAAHYLKQLGVKAGGATYKNVISLVARHMERGKVFDGIAACNTEYEEAVKGYVDDLRVLRVF